MSTAFIKSNKNLIIIGAIFLASVFGATATTQVLSSQKAEAGKYVCTKWVSRNVNGRIISVCVANKYVKTYECWRVWGWLGPRTVCGLR